MPSGVVEEECIPILEESSCLKAGADFAIAYSPERINPGDKQHLFETITRVMSAQDARTLDHRDECLCICGDRGHSPCSLDPPCGGCESHREYSARPYIALMNELSLMCQALNIDTGDVLAAARTKWNFMPFQPGLVGGHFIGVDPYYLTYRAEKAGHHPRVILAGRRINDGMGQRVARECVRGLLRRKAHDGTVTILRLTFNEDVPDTRNSRVIDVNRERQSFELMVQIHDPLANAADARHEYGVKLTELHAPQPADAMFWR
jgi:UDP-N-acetyl-D-galactosamine dehydrogenase